MIRSTSSVVVLLLLLTAACGGRAEQQILRGYFDACAAADDVALANVAVVALDPVRDGVVGHFRVVDVGPAVLQPAATNPRATQLSLFDPLTRTSASGVVMVTRDVQVSADVHRGGAKRRVPMLVTLARAEAGSEVGRWVIVRLVLDGRTLPEVSFARPSGISR